ncbi:MAG: S9 family peptidase [Chloroflexi bacterium AL-W]|nr:S9 family peptidase [Chloroflexi bacterium AL-N1]NOK65460.1 S9 family peptidase [Chloroflexi bacterium AL-N10]NOK72274.1 S9 family peptidase [Chloroflexi bacterium AL-N5]NOK79640.1 S9 family peptidase [Chloroflexi bacterium AL-W]
MRYVSILLVLILSVSVISNTTAQSAPGVIDFAPDAPLAPILSEEEVAKIAQLQATTNVFILSPVSPDRQTVLTLLGRELAFLDVQDGTTIPINDAFFGLSLLGGLAGSYHWSDTDTLATLAIIPPEEEDAAPQLQRVELDRASGAVSTEPLSAMLSGMFIDVAPDLSQILVLIEPQTQEAPTTQTVQLSSYKFAIDPSNPHNPLELQELEITTQSANLMLLDTTTGNLRTLTEFPAGADIQGAMWNLAHSEVAVTYTGVRDRFDDQQALDGALLSSLVYRDSIGALPPEDNPFFQNNELLLFNLMHDEVQSIHAADGNGDVFTASGSWSTDGATLMMKVHQPAILEGREHPIYLREESVSYRFYNRDLQAQGQITGTDWAPSATHGTFVSATTVLFSAGTGTNIWLYTYDLTTDTLRVVSEHPGTFGPFLETNAQIISDSTQIVYAFNSFVSPPELYRSNLDGTEPQQLTQVNAAVAEASATRMDAVTFTLANGQTREGWLLQPTNASFPPKDVPIVMWQEGGPGFVMNNRWGASVESPFALLPNFDMAVLVVPLAGREGYGAEVFNTLYDNTNFGQIDIDEMAEISQQMLDDGWVAHGQLGISGCSYGGYFSLQSIARYPDLYAAANPQCALIDLVVEWTRGYATTLPFIQGASTPYTAPQEYQDDSPSYNVEQMAAPVLTFHGTADFLPITLNENLHQQLVDQEVPARMIRFIGEGHGLGTPSSQLYAAQEQLDWFRTYLVERPDPGPGAGPDQFRVMLPLIGS